MDNSVGFCLFVWDSFVVVRVLFTFYFLLFLLFSVFKIRQKVCVAHEKNQHLETAL